MNNSLYKYFSNVNHIDILFLFLFFNFAICNLTFAQNDTDKTIRIKEIKIAPHNSNPIKVLNIEYTPIHKGLNYLYVTIKNETDKDLNVGLDLLTSSPYLYLGKWQWQYAFLIRANEKKPIEVPLIYRGLTSTPNLKITFGIPLLNKWGFIHIKEPYYERILDLKTAENAETVFSKFTKYHTDSDYFDIFAYQGYLNKKEVRQIVQERKSGYLQIRSYLSTVQEPNIRFLFYPDNQTKQRETGHIGIGWAIDSTIVEVYNDTTRFDSFHELVHIFANELGTPPAVFNEGLAIYLSEKFGSDALKYFGNSDRKIDHVVKKLSEEKKLIPIDSLLGYSNIGDNDYAKIYAQAGSFVKYLIESYGLEKFKNAYRRLKTGSDKQTFKNNYTIFKNIYGKEILEIERNWLEKLTGR